MGPLAGEHPRARLLPRTWVGHHSQESSGPELRMSVACRARMTRSHAQLSASGRVPSCVLARVSSTQVTARKPLHAQAAPSHERQSRHGPQIARVTWFEQVKRVRQALSWNRKVVASLFSKLGFVLLRVWCVSHPWETCIPLPDPTPNPSSHVDETLIAPSPTASRSCARSRSPSLPHPVAAQLAAVKVDSGAETAGKKVRNSPRNARISAF